MDARPGPAESTLVEALHEHGQEHVLHRIDRLDAPARARLLAQLACLDLGRLREFRRLLDAPPSAPSGDDIRPAPVEVLPTNEAGREREAGIARLGLDALRADRVAALTVAGGQGTRLGYPHPKGLFPVSPVRGKSLFQWLGEKVLAARRRHGCGLPWLIMTSPDNDAETRGFFERNAFFGLGADTVHFFTQGVNPILSEDGRLLLADADRLLVGPDGHGGLFDALARSGLIEMLARSGRDLISCFQVDNPLMDVADPRFLGHHIRRGAGLSSKVLAKRSPDERLGLAVILDGRPAVVEYSDVPGDIAAARLPDGELRLRFGSIAAHVLSVPFVEDVARDERGLPWHVARKTYEVLDDEGRRTVRPGCVKFERFLFDALAFCRETAFVEVRRESQFAPVKNALGDDSPDSARRMMRSLWLEWLRSAGVRVPEQEAPPIEISPLYADSEEEFRLRMRPGRPPTFPLVLDA